MIRSAICRLVERRTASLTILCLVLNLPCHAQQEDERTFSTPGEAVSALYTAVKANDEQSLTRMFGKGAADVMHSGDEVADRNMVQTFLRRYDQMHRVVIEPDGTATLYIGAENWPFPISIAKTSSDSWHFDVVGGKQEILYRRVGRNENDAIEICQALVEAQREYISAVRSSESSKHYALKFISDDGKQNGLFWKASEGETPSPIGPLIVQAASEGYSAQQGQPTPFHGYYYRILTKQGNFAKGGKKERAELSGVFSLGVLGSPDESEPWQPGSFDLELFKNPDITFPTKPADNISSVRVIALRVQVHRRPGGRLTFEVSSRNAETSVYDLIEVALNERKTRLADVTVLGATLQVIFRKPKEKDHRISIKLSADSHDLGDTAEDHLLRDYLKRWKIERNA